ncbi:hypothetical protein IOCL2690_000192600 [Leishmania lindenbergi]|uniref:Uncharacterized protein n=1 Tax=Leishmania lindenbergi TaxID=651832 RepID=A0AAW3ASC5_9TRYP
MNTNGGTTAPAMSAPFAESSHERTSSEYSSESSPEHTCQQQTQQRSREKGLCQKRECSNAWRVPSLDHVELNELDESSGSGKTHKGGGGEYNVYMRAVEAQRCSSMSASWQGNNSTFFSQLGVTLKRMLQEGLHPGD